MRTCFKLARAKVERGIKAGILAAEKDKLRLTLAVVDDGGTINFLCRMDGASSGSVSLALAKARTAAKLGIPTAAVEEAVKESPNMLSLEGIIAFSGGLPILYRDERLGGVGVSGAAPERDSEIARLILDAMLAPD
jgi:glc operon protein GlcG